MATNYRIAALDASIIAGMTDADIARHIDRFEQLQAQGDGGYASPAEEDAGRLLYNERDERAGRAVEAAQEAAAKAQARSPRRPKGKAQWFVVTSADGRLALIQGRSGADVEDAVKRHGFDSRRGGVCWEPLDGMVYGHMTVVGMITVIPMEAA